MSSVTIVSHFSDPKWPMVNKLSAICKCLDVSMLHCSSLAKLKSTLKNPPRGRLLFFTDEGMIDLIQELDQSQLPIEVAMLIISPISTVAQKVDSLRIVKYLIGTEPAESYGRDLSILIKKFSDGDILDLDKYLAFGCKIHKRTVNSQKTKRDAIDAVSRYISRLGDPGYRHPYDEYARRVSELADELLLNAIYDANPRLQNADRSQPFQLTAVEQIEMSFGYDGEYFGVSVRDPFGRFNSETIFSYMASYRQSDKIASAKSAGLGLKFIFEKAHQVITNVKESKLTEVIAMVRLPNRLLEFERQKKSFYFFGEQTNAQKGGG